MIVAVTSRAIFNLEQAHRIFRGRGIKAYDKYQRQNENRVLDKGAAFHLVSRLDNLRHPSTRKRMIEVILVSKNSPTTGLRAFNSIEKYKLNIQRAVFTGGAPNYKYLKSLGVNLFLSADHADVKNALIHGIPSAALYTEHQSRYLYELHKYEIRFAFDGDSVVFSDEADKVYRAEGLEEFLRTEAQKMRIPLGAGPFKAFLDRICKIRQAFPDDKCPIRLALVTSRGAPAHRRAINTLRHWGISFDEAFFLGGRDKTSILQSYSPHIYFEDQRKYAEPASRKVPTGRVL